MNWFKENKIFWTSYLLLLGLALISLATQSREELFTALNGDRNQLADTLMPYITNLGDGAFFVVIIATLLLVRYRFALAAALSYGISSALAQGLKRLVFVKELRPKAYFKDSLVTVHTAPGIELHSFNSFPSGHSTTAFAIACLLALCVKNKNWSSLFLLLATLAALSRVYLGQHFFADITAGSVLGVISSVLAYKWANSINKKQLDYSLLKRM